MNSIPPSGSTGGPESINGPSNDPLANIPSDKEIIKLTFPSNGDVKSVEGDMANLSPDEQAALIAALPHAFSSMSHEM